MPFYTTLFLTKTHCRGRILGPPHGLHVRGRPRDVAIILAIPVPVNRKHLLVREDDYGVRMRTDPL